MGPSRDSVGDNRPERPDLLVVSMLSPVSMLLLVPLRVPYTVGSKGDVHNGTRLQQCQPSADQRPEFKPPAWEDAADRRSAFPTRHDAAGTVEEGLEHLKGLLGQADPGLELGILAVVPARKSICQTEAPAVAVAGLGDSASADHTDSRTWGPKRAGPFTTREVFGTGLTPGSSDIWRRRGACLVFRNGILFTNPPWGEPGRRWMSWRGIRTVLR